MNLPRRRGVPVVTLVLVGACWVAFAIDAAHPADLAHSAALQAGAVSPLAVVTAPFAHFSVGHLALNSVVILAAGWYVERHRGPRVMLAATVAIAAVSTTLTAVVLQGVTTPVLVVGASAIGFGVVGVAAAVAWGQGFEPTVFAAATVVLLAGSIVHGLLVHGVAPGGGITALSHLFGFVGALAFLAARSGLRAARPVVARVSPS